MAEIDPRTTGLPDEIGTTFHVVHSADAPADVVGLSGFVGEKQAGPFACWAAVVASLVNHAKRAPGEVRQCDIIEQFFKPLTGRYCMLHGTADRRCARGCYAPGYEVGHTLEDVMKCHNVLETKGATPVSPAGKLPHLVTTMDGIDVASGWCHAELRSLLATRRAVALRVDPLHDGEATMDHFIVVYQAERNGDGIFVYDPARSVPRGEPISFSTLEQKHGKISWKYITRPLP